jgi:hypothetical protein
MAVSILTKNIADSEVLSEVSLWRLKDGGRVPPRRQVKGVPWRPPAGRRRVITLIAEVVSMLAACRAKTRGDP